ncbi:succinate--CoA ligase beta chain, partial [Pestalotiopsis sp. IQ-011]
MIIVMASAVTKKRERVYLACRAIFSGSKALIRKKRLVAQEIRDHGAALASLSDIDNKEINVIVRDLLEKQVFESDLKARLQFPKLFQSSAERDALREASELDAAQSVAEILEE